MGLSPITGTASLLTYRTAFQCQEKPIDKPLAVFNRHPAVIVEVLLQVSEDSFDFVVRIRHAFAPCVLECEQIWHVETDAVDKRSESLMREERSAVLACRPPVYGLFPFFLPSRIAAPELFLPIIRQSTQQGL